MRHYICRILLFAVFLMSITTGFEAMPYVLAAETPKSAVQTDQPVTAEILEKPVAGSTFKLADVPEYQDTTVLLVNGNMPDFYIWQVKPESYISFSPLDKLQRTGAGMACLSRDTIPTEARGKIGNIRPSGWHTIRYDDLIEDKYLYNRSHVLGFQLSGDNATPENLFTGTRFLNKESMLFFENQVADYLNQKKENHVIYRVSPVYHENELVPTGVQMEAFSVEDYGQGVCFNVFLYNIQPGVLIDYATGESRRDPDYKSGEQINTGDEYRKALEQLKKGQKDQAADKEALALNGLPAEKTGEGSRSAMPAVSESETSTQDTRTVTYILNTNTHKFHHPDCPSVSDIKARNKKEFYGTRDEAISAGYSSCGRCNP